MIICHFTNINSAEKQYSYFNLYTLRLCIHCKSFDKEYVKLVCIISIYIEVLSLKRMSECGESVIHAKLSIQKLVLNFYFAFQIYKREKVFSTHQIMQTNCSIHHLYNVPKLHLFLLKIAIGRKESIFYLELTNYVIYR